MQAGGTGLFTYRYDQIKTDTAWISNVYAPVMTELALHTNAFSRPPLVGQVHVTGDAQVVATVYKLHSAHRHLVLIIHHGLGQVKPKLTFVTGFQIKSVAMVPSGKPISVNKNAFTIDLGEYEVSLLEIKTKHP